VVGVTDGLPRLEGSSEFVTAAEYFGVDEVEDRSLAADAPAFAKSIVWYDQATPVFVCEHHHDDTAPLRHTGDEQLENPETVRTRAYEHLLTEGPRCDVCAGTLPEKVDP
jgi:hypothetical protein